jgi:hypothetical protein
MFKKIALVVSLLFLFGCEQKIQSSVSELIKSENKSMENLDKNIIYEYPYFFSFNDKTCQTEAGENKNFFEILRGTDDKTKELLQNKTFKYNNDVFILEGDILGVEIANVMKNNQ